ncbi:hypothetical protein B5C06_07610 [Staphylococcus delphini]|nr:hypothetical protein B5C06_07610 [Staphylococcus delphini]
MCQVLGVSRSGDDWKNRKPSARTVKREGLKKDIYQISQKRYKRYGSPKITQILRRHGHTITRRTVSRMMKKLGIRSITKKKYKATTDSKHHLPVSPNLLNQQFKVSQLGSVWVADITYVYTKEGWLYLATVMALFSRRIIGWAMPPRMTKALVMSALNKAYTIQEPREGLIHHSDQGSQYASIEYQNLLREKGIQSSMRRKGNCYDNACITSFHSIIKKELIHHQNYKTRNEAMFSIVEYILTFYNSKSVHSTLNDMSPIEFEKKYTTKSPSSECTF